MQLTTRSIGSMIVCSLILSMSLFANAYGQWVQTGGPNAQNVTSLAVIDSRLFAGTFAGGVFVTTTGGNTWDAVNNGLSNPIINSLAVSGTALFAATAGDGVFRSTDFGATWVAVNTDLTNTDVSSLLVSGTHLFAGTTDGVFLSTNDGASWTVVNNGLTTTSVSSLALVDTTIFAGTIDGIYKSTDYGTSWTNASSGLTSTLVYALSSAGRFLFAATAENIFLSRNKGASWAATTLPSNTFVTSVTYGSGADANYFVGTLGDGVFRSYGNIVDWTDLSVGLTNVDVRALAIAGNDLIAATYGAGVWKRPLAEVFTDVEDEYKADPAMAQQILLTYPNPASDAATIRLQVSTPGVVTLELFDALNNSVATLVQERMQFGTYNVRVDTKGLPSGVYYCRMQSNEASDAKRLVVIH